MGMRMSISQIIIAGFLAVVSSAADSSDIPDWGVGAQIGYGWGVAIQKRSFFEGSLNLAFNDVRAQFDYLKLFSPNLDPLDTNTDEAIRRGSIVPYVGLGIEATSKFVGLRVPLGAEYTFAEAPLSGFGAVIPTFHRVGYRTSWNLGARYLF